MRITLFTLSLTVSFFISFSQNWSIKTLGDLPFRTSNNAVTLAYVDGEPHVFSFSGIDETLASSGIHLKSASVNILTGESKQYPDVPDTLGKVAAAASYLNGKIFVIGGYHVFEDGSELSSNKVHCFDPQKGIWEEDHSPLPLPIDDHVQAVWNDSLIYIISGWSDTKNVPNVQIYSPSLDSWSNGTSVPENNRYMAFGASGTIIGNTIYYLGGASMTNNFPSSFWLRIGTINPVQPNQIKWRDSLLRPEDKMYRAACTDISGYPVWFGGSDDTYNYDAKSYRDGSIVSPSNKSILLADNLLYRTKTTNLPMDVRGVGGFNGVSKIIAGGMYSNREVSSQVLKLTWGFPLSLDKIKPNTSNLHPIPCNQELHISYATDYKIYNTFGKQVATGIKSRKVNTSALTNGVYFLRSNNRIVKFIVQH